MYSFRRDSKRGFWDRPLLKKVHPYSPKGLSVWFLGILLAAFVGAKVDAQFGSSSKRVAPQLPDMVFDRTADFLQWLPQATQYYNDIIFQAQTLRLSDDAYKRETQDKRRGRPAPRSPQGFMQASKSLSENSYVCAKIVSQTEAIDFAFRLNHKFTLIVGDGDRRTIGFKPANSTLKTNQYGYLPPEPMPDGNTSHTDRLGRYKSDVSLPQNGEEVTICMTIQADSGSTEKEIKASMSVFGEDGKPLDLGPMPVWKYNDPTQTNGENNIALGLVDSRGDHPLVELRAYCAVEMNDKHNEPSPREEKLCEHP